MCGVCTKAYYSRREGHWSPIIVLVLLQGARHCPLCPNPSAANEAKPRLPFSRAQTYYDKEIAIFKKWRSD